MPVSGPGERVSVTANAGGIELAGAGQRLLARILDEIVFSFIMFIVTIFAGVNAMVAVMDPIKFLIPIIIGYFAFIGINIYFLSTNGQTIGKKLMGIRIVRHPDAGRASLPGIIILRMFLMSIIIMIPIIGWLIGLINIFFVFRTDRRMIHDMLAGTMVVRA
jgi:uncharacterized RDD family membrane protein YckC